MSFVRKVLIFGPNQKYNLNFLNLFDGANDKPIVYLQEEIMTKFPICTCFKDHSIQYYLKYTKEIETMSESDLNEFAAAFFVADMNQFLQSLSEFQLIVAQRPFLLPSLSVICQSEQLLQSDKNEAIKEQNIFKMLSNSFKFHAPILIDEFTSSRELFEQNSNLKELKKRLHQSTKAESINEFYNELYNETLVQNENQPQIASNIADNISATNRIQNFLSPITQPRCRL